MQFGQPRYRLIICLETPADKNLKNVIYFCGQALGLQPKNAKKAVNEVSFVVSVLLNLHESQHCYN